MVSDITQHYKLVGETIILANAIESKIDCIISDEYFGSSPSEKRRYFDKEVLMSNSISLAKKIDILFAIMNRRGLKFSTVRPKELKTNFVDLRNRLAHATVEYDIPPDYTPYDPIPLKFFFRGKIRSYEEEKAVFDKLGRQIATELEVLFSDALWGVIDE